MIDPDAQAFADAYLADPTDDDMLDHHAARMVAQPWFNVEDASAMYLSLWRAAAHQDCWCHDLDTTPCGSWLWLDVDTASIVYDLAVAEEHPAPDWRQFQELVWIGRLDDTLRAEVAW
jgi:hypothetical protein